MVEIPDNKIDVDQEVTPQVTPTEPPKRFRPKAQKPSFAVQTAGGFTGDILKSGAGASPILEQAIKEEPKQEFTSMEVLKSAFALENTIGSTVANLKAGNVLEQEEDPDFDVIGRLSDTKYEPYLDNFITVFNENQFNAVAANIDREEHHRNVIASSGARGLISSIIAGVFDPINLIPIGGSAYKTFKSGKVMQGIVEGAQVAGLSAAASESVLQSQQDTRTIEESALNIAGGALLGGLIGGFAGKLSKADYQNLSKRVEDDIQRTESQINIDENGNLSAAKVERTTLDQETLAGGKITKAVISSTKKLNPMLRVLEGSSLEARKLIPRLVRTNMYFKKNAQDIATDQSVEIAIKQYDAGLGRALQANRKLAKKANKRIRSETGQRLSITKFNDEVALAMIKGDKSDIPEVQQAAQAWRRDVFDPLKEQAIKQGILPEDVNTVTATSYLMRRYNVNKMIAQEADFKEIIKTAARERLIPEIEAKLAKTEKTISAKQFKKFQNERKGIDAKIAKAQADELDKLIDRRIELDILVGDEQAIQDYVKEIATSVFDNIRGIERKGVNMPYDMKLGVRGPAKERILTFVKDEEIRPFLETDIEKLAKGYTNIMATDVELKRAFGDLNLEPQKKEIKLEFDELRKKVKTEKERSKLKDEENEVIEIIDAFKDMLRGNYGRPNNPDSFWPRAARISRNIQYLSKLGGVTVSSTPDMSRHVMVHGYSRVFSKGLKNVITNTKGIKLSIADAKESGNILEAVTHQMSALKADLGDPYSNSSRFETMLSWMSDKFGKVTLLDFWNDYQKGFASVLTQQRLIQNVRNFDNIKAKEKRYMAFLGIDSKNVDLIKQQLLKHSSKEKDLDLANLAKWDNDAAARLYKNALNTDVDRTIVTKGIGDTPLLMNTELGKTIFQFKSFSFAAHQQITIAALQQKDAAALSGIATMISMGMLVYHLKMLAIGKETSDDPEVWLAEGIDRSGIIPVIAEINGVADVFGFGAGNLTGAQPLSRFATRNRVGGFVGPSFGGVKDAVTFSTALASGDIKESDLKALRRTLPYQNVFYLRGILDKLQEKLPTK